MRINHFYPEDGRGLEICQRRWLRLNLRTKLNITLKHTWRGVSIYLQGSDQVRQARIRLRWSFVISTDMMLCARDSNILIFGSVSDFYFLVNCPLLLFSIPLRVQNHAAKTESPQPIMSAPASISFSVNPIPRLLHVQHEFFISLILAFMQ